MKPEQMNHTQSKTKVTSSRTVKPEEINYIVYKQNKENSQTV